MDYNKVQTILFLNIQRLRSWHHTNLINPGHIVKGLWKLLNIGIEPYKAWDYVTNKDSFINLFIYISWFLFIIPFALIGYSIIHAPHHLHCIWLGCIKSCVEDSIHGFLIEWWVAQNMFMNLLNPYEIIVYYLRIGRITFLAHGDGFPMASALVHVMRTKLNLWWIMM